MQVSLQMNLEVGAAAGAAIWSIIPGVGTSIGSDAAGIIGSFIGDVVTSPPEQQQQQQQKERGGILLAGDVDLCSKLNFELDSLDKIVLDSNDNLIISSENNKSVSVSNCCVKEEEFHLAHLIVYRNFEISFSLDPWDPLNPDGPSYQKVFYPSFLENTSIGHPLFECDYIMKKLSFGLLPLPPNVVSALDHSLNNMLQDHPKQSRHRLWVVSQNAPLEVKMIDKEWSLFQCL